MHTPRRSRGRLASAAVAVGMTIALAVAAAVASTNSTAAQTRTHAKAAQPITIGVDLYSQIEHRWTYDENYFKQYAKQLGVNVVIRFANNSSTTQSNDVAALLAKHVDALVVAPVDVNLVDPLIAQARAQHVPFVDYDISVPKARPDYVVVRNQEQACRYQVRAALAYAPKGNYALVEGDAGNDLAQACHKVYNQMLGHRAGIHIVYQNWTPAWDTATALKDGENILTRNHGDITAFVSTNDSMALGIIQALQERHLAGKVFVSGLNADPANLKAVAAGTQMMTIWTPINTEVMAALKAAIALVKHKTPPHNGIFTNAAGKIPAFFIPNIVVTKHSLCNYLKKDSPPPAWGAPTIKGIFGKPTCAG